MIVKHLLASDHEQSRYSNLHYARRRHLGLACVPSPRGGLWPFS